MRRTTLLAALFSLVLALWAPPVALASGPGTFVPGAANDPFTGSPAPARSVGRSGFRFYGSGYGHGIGMSQYGSYGLALMGWSYRRILTNFYRGTKVEADPDPVEKLRVGLTDDRTLIHLGARSGPVRLWVGSPHGKRVARIPGGKTWTVRATAKGYAVRDSAGKLIGGKTWGGTGYDLFATYADTGSRVFVKEADAVSGVGYVYKRAYLEFNLYRRGGSWSERIILPIALEQYLYGIGEMPSSWPAQALQTQAVASRTFATYTVRRYARRSYCNCDISDGANDQVYIGDNKEDGTMGNRWVHAVDATKKRIVTSRGKVIQAFFAASDGGHSDSVEDVWHGGDPRYAVSYLKAECDPGEYFGDRRWTNWQRSLTTGELTSRLSPYTGRIGTVTAFPKIRRGAGGRIIRATVRGGSGKATVTGTELKAAISAWDDRIWINKNMNILGPIRSRYDALMCRPGLPRSAVTSVPGGAKQKFHVGGIYRNGDADVTVWLKGAIYKEYVAVKGTAGKLDLPTSQVGTVEGSGGGKLGTRVLFEGGRIYAKAGGGAHSLWGGVLKAYIDRGGPTGSLGFPTSRVHDEGSVTSATFEHGTITCDAGSCSVS
jgi:SpoIID/LytB domain protein